MQTVIGAGEVGEAIGRTLEDFDHEVEWSDPNLDPKRPSAFRHATTGKDSDALHICFPYGPEFIEQVRRHFICHPTTTVIVHSTVKPGTCNQLADVLAESSYLGGRLPPAIVFSPIRGSHRSNYNDGGLRPALKRLVKYYAVVSDEAGQAETRFLQIFRGLTLKAFPDVRSLEFAKVMSTTYFGWNIAFEKRMHEACEKHGFDFDAAYTDWNRTYNDGMPEQFRRPVIQHREGKIGGHCVIANLLLLDDIEEVGPLFDEVILWG